MLNKPVFEQEEQGIVMPVCKSRNLGKKSYCIIVMQLVNRMVLCFITNIAGRVESFKDLKTTHDRKSWQSLEKAYKYGYVQGTFHVHLSYLVLNIDFL